MFVRTIALGFGIVGGVVASQLPEFEQQYRQRLGGAVDELRRIVQRYDDNAKAEGLTLPGMIERLRANTDGVVRREAATVADITERFAILSARYQRAEQGSTFERVGGLVFGADQEVARRTLDDFSPALPLTIAGGLSALAGFATGLLGVHGASAIVHRAGRRRKAIPVRS